MSFFLTNSDRDALRRLLAEIDTPFTPTLRRGRPIRGPQIRLIKPTTAGNLEASSGSTVALSVEWWRSEATTDNESLSSGSTPFDVYDWLGSGLSNSDTTGSTDLRCFAIRPIPSAKWYAFIPGFQDIEVKLAAALTTGTSVVGGVVLGSFGFGQFISTDSTVTLKNAPTKAGNFTFSGDTSDICYARWDHGKTFRIYQKEC